MRTGQREIRTLRCAVADGATEASFAGLWADRLVRAFGRGQIKSGRIVADLAPLQVAWWTEVRGKPLPWYAEEKLRSGAFSSLLGLTLTERRRDRRMMWTALAVGDSCLFVVRAGRLLQSFPLQQSHCFDNSPVLISSLPARNRSLETVLRTCSGSGESGDRFYLMTDAVACWFLARWEHGDEPWTLLDALADDESGERLDAWLEEQRGAHALRNDDVTVLRVSLE